MLNYPAIKKDKLKWIGYAKPEGEKKLALLVPQYNERTHCNFGKRLAYFKKLEEEYREEMDVIIIDDGSTDGSLEYLTNFLLENKKTFYVASVFPNANKVGALYATILSISHEFVILSDFDTDIVGLPHLIANLDILRNDRSLMGCYFRMLPYEGKGPVYDFQQLEYCLLRSLYKFHKKDQSIPVMPGAGSCYKKNVLTGIYIDHSGLRNGEDREATLIGMKLGYKACYMADIQTLTRPPLTFNALTKQRKRWYLGYLETLYKEKVFYWAQIKSLSSIGVRTVLDLIVVALIILLPFILILTTIINPYSSLFLLAIIYACYFLGTLHLLLFSSGERKGGRRGSALSVMLFPGFKITVEYISWMKAIFAFTNKLKSGQRYDRNRSLYLTRSKEEVLDK